jgi:hypothetical protein
VGKTTATQTEGRRPSWSSSESGLAPATPFPPSGFQQDTVPRIAPMESSPSTGFPAGPGINPMDVNWLYQNQLVPRLKSQMYDTNLAAQDFRISVKVKEHPAIPPAIPAIFSHGNRSLAESLSNPTGTSNVYIRGLTPDTSDESLYSWCSRFGHIISHKAIIDNNHGSCKG